MRLTDGEKSILDGNQGEASRVALSVLVDLGTLYGAEDLMKVSQVHNYRVSRNQYRRSTKAGKVFRRDAMVRGSHFMQQ